MSSLNIGRQNLITTAASESYRPQLLSLLGSLRCNWPEHPPVLVYDLGLARETVQVLLKAGIDVQAVPPFVPHWRKHFTWKLWCMNNAPSENVLWMDAGCCVLRPVPEVFEINDQQGYFCLPNYRPLELEASEEACEGCRVQRQFPVGKISLAAGFFGFRRGSVAERVVQESLSVALTERYIKASKPEHRHDQAILSLLMYREFSPLIMCDGAIYFFEDPEARFTTHRIWAARRNMHYKDKRIFASFLEGPVVVHLPRASHKKTWWYKSALQVKLAINWLNQQLGRRSRIYNGIR